MTHGSLNVRRINSLNPPVTAAQIGSPKSGSRQEDSDILTLSFDDNRLLSLLCGEHDENLALIEHRLGVDITPRGNRLAVRGSDSAAERGARRADVALQPGPPRARRHQG